jgi:hypothetical protein
MKMPEIIKVPSGQKAGDREKPVCYVLGSFSTPAEEV